jgi:phenylalanyl-tRNA synthetase beta chain
MISSLLDALMRNVGIKYELRKATHPSFMTGRTAEIIVNKKIIGYIGEIHPQILNNWELEKPVVAFELNIEELN